MNTETILTPENCPDHDIIGHHFQSFGGVYFCESYDPRLGYWMQNIVDPGDRRNVSERAPYRTFHKAYPRENGAWQGYKFPTVTTLAELELLAAKRKAELSGTGGK